MYNLWLWGFIMKTSLELYKVFYVVAKHKHMTRASEELHISQPAISQSIKKLEEQLGGTLFLRSLSRAQIDTDTYTCHSGAAKETETWKTGKLKQKNIGTGYLIPTGINHCRFRGGRLFI